MGRGEGRGGGVVARGSGGDSGRGSGGGGGGVGVREGVVVVAGERGVRWSVGVGCVSGCEGWSVWRQCRVLGEGLCGVVEWRRRVRPWWCCAAGVGVVLGSLGEGY